MQHGLQLYFSVEKTIETTTTCLAGIERLTEDYLKKCALIGDVRAEDSIFYAEAKTLYAVLMADFHHLGNQVEVIGPFIGGKYGFGCTVHTLSEMLNDLLETLSDIREHVSGCYHRLYRYMRLRLGFWTKYALRAYSAKASAEEAFTRWSAVYHQHQFQSITRRNQ